MDKTKSKLAAFFENEEEESFPVRLRYDFFAHVALADDVPWI